MDSKEYRFLMAAGAIVIGGGFVANRFDADYAAAFAWGIGFLLFLAGVIGALWHRD